MGEIIFFSTLK